ncbi:MAG: type IV secretion protein IcmK [Gammaproteobacteria bacterium]|nr:type IV secretion protein IcmK [Gammaproteobacteria bacterium]
MNKKRASRGKILSGIFFLSLAVLICPVADAVDANMSASAALQSAVSEQLQMSNEATPTTEENTASATPTSAHKVSNSADETPIPQVKTIDSLQDNAAAATLFPEPKEQQKQAFKALTQATMPMSPGQVIRLHRMLNLMQKAVAASPLTPPVPVVTTRVVSLAPGVTPPVIRLGQGFVTSVLFVDSTGQPWPISAYDIGDSKSFNIQPPKQDGNMMMIQAMKPYTYGNMAVTLKGMRTPVMITLVPGQKMVDYRVDLHISRMGPKAAKVAGGDNLPAPANSVLLEVLNGVSPKGAKVLKVSGGKNVLAWRVGSRLYLRTRMTIISPAWISMMRSSDGTKAYELQQTPSILISRAGRLINLEIEGL